MATTNSIQDILNARNIAVIRGDSETVRTLDIALQSLTGKGGLPDFTDDGLSKPSIFDKSSPQTPHEPGGVVDLTTVTMNPSATSLIDTNVSIPVNTGIGGIPTQSINTLSQTGNCDYRYSFGCPVFSRYISDAGCRILLPVYRTCHVKASSATSVNNTALPSVEMVGNIEITAWGEHVSDTQQNYTNSSGEVGRRYVEGTRLTSNGLRSAIEQLFGVKNITNWVLSTDGIYRNSSNQLSLETVLNNLEDITTTTLPGTTRGRGTLDSWADYLSKSCDLSKQPAYCISSETFTANKKPDTSNNTTTGKFCNTQSGKVAIPNTKKLDRTESRLIQSNTDSEQYIKVPNKPCVLGLARQIQSVQIYSENYGYPCYSQSDFGGSIVGYDSIEARETTTFGDVSVTYVSERPDPNCSYVETESEYEEDDISNPCIGIIKKDVIRKYDDGRQETYAKGVFVRYFRKMDADCSPETFKIYHPFDLGSDVISGKVKARTTGLFNSSQSLSCFHTSSNQSTATKNFYYEVTDCDTCGRTPYFAVAYGNSDGSGSLYASGDTTDTSTKAIYSQYRLLALDLPDTAFTFYTSGVPTASKSVYIVNYYRDGISDRLDPGNFELALAQLTGTAYANSLYTGSNVAVSSSNKILTFIDDSGDTSEATSCVHDPYTSYNIVSGSLLSGAYSNAATDTYGIVYPNLGIIVLDPYKLNMDLSFNTVSGSNIAGDNAMKLFKSISGSAVLGSDMKARNVQYKTTNHYFVRVLAPFVNYSNNPTYVSGSDGYLLHNCFENNPNTYITSVGLYNDFNELLAVAKLSQPVNKTFDNDVLIKIRLNW